VTKQKTIIIVATLFFLIVQWYGVFFMMYNHPGPLGIDDALAYISNIEFRIAPPAEYILIPDRDQILFSLAYGTLARALGISATAMFHANFYIGLFLMGLDLLLFLKKPTARRSSLLLRSASLLFMKERAPTMDSSGWVPVSMRYCFSFSPHPHCSTRNIASFSAFR